MIFSDPVSDKYIFPLKLVPATDMLFIIWQMKAPKRYTLMWEIDTINLARPSLSQNIQWKAARRVAIDKMQLYHSLLFIWISIEELPHFIHQT